MVTSVTMRSEMSSNDPPNLVDNYERRKPHHPLVFLPISFICSYVFAYVYAIMWHKSIPEDWEQYGFTVEHFLHARFVILFSLGLLWGIVGYPMLYFGLHDRRTTEGVCFVVVCVLVEIVVVTPLSWLAGAVGAFVIFAAALFAYKRYGRPLNPPVS